MQEQLFTIGSFAKLGQVSVDTLRHYAQLELLTPAYTEQHNGYRYYQLSQLMPLERIRELRLFGFSLADIKTMQEKSELTLGLYLERLQALQTQQQELAQLITQLTHKIKEVQHG